MRDGQTGEKDIADVLTSNALVIEFQHPHLDPKDRAAREAFYKEMVWVVNGARLKNDYQRLLKAKSNFRVIKTGIYNVELSDACFPEAWLTSLMPVVFDFRRNEASEYIDDMREYLYCLFPIDILKSAVFAVLSRDSFVSLTRNGQWTSWVVNSIKEVLHYKKYMAFLATRQRQQQKQALLAKLRSPARYKKYR